MRNSSEARVQQSLNSPLDVACEMLETQTNLIKSTLIPRKTDGTEAFISQTVSREVISPQTSLQDNSGREMALLVLP